MKRRRKRDKLSKSLPEWEHLGDAASALKLYSNSHLPQLLKSFDKCKLLDSMTCGKIMVQLKHAKKISPANQLMLQNLGLLPRPEQEEKQRPGRPKKSI